MTKLKVNPHADKQHVGRPLTADVERMLNADEYTRATCSFPDKHCRDILVSEVMREEAAAIELWLNDRYAPRRYAVRHTFNDDDAIRLGVPTKFVGVYADETMHIRFGTTRTVTAVLQKVEDDIELFNAFPNMSLYHRTPIEAESVLPFAKKTESWREANMLKRTYYQMRCDQTFKPAVSWDETTATITMDITESDGVLGNISFMGKSSIWRIDGDKRSIMDNEGDHRHILRRAYPRTHAALMELCSTYLRQLADKDLAYASYDPQNDLPDLVAIYAPQPRAKQDQEAQEKKSSATEAIEQKLDARARARQKALERSRKAHPKAQRKPKKTKKQPSKTSTTSPTRTEPFQFKRVKTKYEEFGLSQEEQNEIYTDISIRHWAILANDLEDECLMPGPILETIYPEYDESMLWFAMSYDEAVRINESKQSPDRAIINKASEQSDNEFRTNIANIAETKRLRAKEMTDGRLQTLLSKIAQDPHWHILLREDSQKNTEHEAVDTMGRKIVRKPLEDAEHVVMSNYITEDDALPVRRPEQKEKPEVPEPAPKPDGIRLTEKFSNQPAQPKFSPSKLIQSMTQETS